MKYVLFDFDGVFIHTHLLSYEIHLELNPTLDYKFFKSLSHGNFIEEYTKAVSEKKIVDNPDFEEKYITGSSKLTMPEELKKTVINLSKDYPFAVVSSSSSKLIKPFMEKEGVLPLFSKILGADTHPSKVVKISNLLKEEGISPKDAIFVTDTTGDIHEARKCEVEAIAVTWGMHEKEYLLTEKPWATVDTPAELESKVREFLC